MQILRPQRRFKARRDNGSECLMKIYHQDGTSRAFEGGPASVSQVLLSLGVNPVEVIVSRGGRVIPDDTVLGPDDEIRIIRVSHGG